MISLHIKRADRLVGMSVLGTLVIVWLILVGFDVLLQFGDAGILDPNDLRRREAAQKPGSTVVVSGIRNGAPFKAQMKMTQRPAIAVQPQQPTR